MLLETDNKNRAPAWHVDKVVVHAPCSDQWYEFACNGWLGGNAFWSKMFTKVRLLDYETEVKDGLLAEQTTFHVPTSVKNPEYFEAYVTNGCDVKIHGGYEFFGSYIPVSYSIEHYMRVKTTSGGSTSGGSRSGGPTERPGWLKDADCAFVGKNCPGILGSLGK